jgi:polysaccharide export outer membrane protein
MQLNYSEKLSDRRKAHGARSVFGSWPGRADPGQGAAKSLRLIGWCVSLGLLFICSGCSTPKKSNAAFGMPTGQSPGILATGDVVRVSFTGAPELNQSQKVGTDGKISLPIVGLVSAQGKTLRTFQAELTQLYASQLQNSEVIVTLDSTVIPVVVSGAVQKPGKIVFDKPSTVLEAIMEAGGFAPEADLAKVAVIRVVNGAHQSRIFDMRGVMRGLPTPAIYVGSGDVIYVSEKLINF